MTDLAERSTTQILLLAPNLLGESLALQLSKAKPELEVFTKSVEMTSHPSLVIWAIENLDLPSAIQIEVRKLQERWQPSPILLVLPAKITVTTNQLLQFGCPGLLQDPDFKILVEAIDTLVGGGRVVRLKEQNRDQDITHQKTLGLGQWLLVSGIQQINNDLISLDILLSETNDNLIVELMLRGRERELKSAKEFLLWLWGPLQVSVDTMIDTRDKQTNHWSSNSLITNLNKGTNISLNSRNSIEVWNLLSERLEKAVKYGLINSTGSLLALEALNPSRKTDLLVALVKQLDQVMARLRKNDFSEVSCLKIWKELQQELRCQALRTMTGNYVRLPLKEEQTPVVDHLLKITDLSEDDEDLPSPELMLEPLLVDRPTQVDGQLLPSDDPRALMQLETLFSNWLIRTAEIVSSEILGACAEWPELRQYMLESRLVSTRELERLRNQLNSQNRWQNLIQRPIQLYESKRLFYKLSQGYIQPVLITEPRDEELRQLGWIQQQVALLVEARDALAPQLQELVKRIGDLMVVLLTKVLGRAIGLVGRGIAQGMGRSLGRG